MVGAYAETKTILFPDIIVLRIETLPSIVPAEPKILSDSFHLSIIIEPLVLEPASVNTAT